MVRTTVSSIIRPHNHVTWMWLLALPILVLLGLKLQLIFLQNINWDEFLYLAKIYSASRGELSSALQSVYIHAFGWLTLVSDNEVEQIIAARAVMFILQVATCALIMALAIRLYRSPAAALIAMLTYLSFSYNVIHGTSFRADPIAAFLLLFALWLLSRERGGLQEILWAALLTAIAGMVTIKSIFYAPTLGLAVLYFRGTDDMRKRSADLLLFSLITLITFALLYLLHRYSLGTARDFSATGMITSSYKKVIELDKLFPNWRYLEPTIRPDLLAWMLMLSGATLAAIALLFGKRQRLHAGLLGLGLPLLSLVFYRNTFPYYYCFVLAAPAVLAAGPVAMLEKRLAHGEEHVFKAIAVILFIVLGANFISYYQQNDSDRTVQQRLVVDTIHRMFPHPIPYIDRSTMIPSFRKVGFFMSTWGIDNYRDAGQPIMRNLLIREHPLFLLATIRTLELDRPYPNNNRALLAEDFKVLQDNFIHHWGVIWVAGKQIEFPAPGIAHAFEILIPGTYTVESPDAISIDGREYSRGSAVVLSPGNHTALSRHANSSLVLRWGQGLYRPAERTFANPIFTGFPIVNP